MLRHPFRALTPYLGCLSERVKPTRSAQHRRRGAARRIARSWSLGALGYRGQGGIAMPSGGRLVERDYAADEMATLSEGAEAAGLSLEASLGLLGATCLDVYLNDRAFWRCVPIRVWRYGLGGYSA